MAVTIDPRPNSIGDMIMITGSYEAGDTTIDLSDFYAPNSIEFFSITPTDTVATFVARAVIEETEGNANMSLQDAFKLADSTCIVTLYQGPATSAGASEPGKFMAMGRRG
jgi:hypothetical protein